jgi:spore cortex formation protein SpoVR/YcgB (stage V sporulation)
MPLKITHKKEEEVPLAGASGRVNQDLLAIKSEMQKLASGMVLEIETGSEKAVRSAKTLVTRASNQLGTRWRHWSVGTKVFAKPAEAVRRRMGRPKKTV